MFTHEGRCSFRFVLEECGRRSTAAAKVMVTGLRSLLRFLSLQGRISAPLASAVPAVAGPASDGLPRACDPGTVDARILILNDREHQAASTGVRASGP
jgi:hypothetical protein